MIHVCDAIMGTGKSSAAISYMNEHSTEKFIYVTPYLEEAARVKMGCPQMKFIEPSDKLHEFNFKKTEHAAYLIKSGRNIATTHQALKMYTEDMLNDIRHHGYKLIVDENIDVLEKLSFHRDDIQIALKAGYLSYGNGRYRLESTDYNGIFFREMFRFIQARELFRMDDELQDGKIEQLFYWVLPPDLITAFSDVFILTYLFEGQSFHHFLEMYHLPYDYMGVQKRQDGTFCFYDGPSYVPEYIPFLQDKIHIVDNKRLNSIGEEVHALSMRWYEMKPNDVEQLKLNIYNVVNNIWRSVDAKDKLWGCFNKHRTKVQGKGYTKAFLSFSTKATNEYRDKTHLIYAVNLFMNVSDKNFYRRNGIRITREEEDMYALSIMVQWIWRSAIRDGKDIYLYIPSRRMRTLLTEWIEKTSRGGNTTDA